MLQFTACFSSRSAVGSGLALRSLVHSEFILVGGVGKWSSFPFLHVSVQFSAHRLLKGLCAHPRCVSAPRLSWV